MVKSFPGIHQHEHQVLPVLYIHGGFRLLVASGDGSATIWDIDHSLVLQTLRHSGVLSVNLNMIQCLNET